MQEPVTTPAAFGAHIRSWRMVLGLTARQLAGRADISHDTLSRLELGKPRVGFDVVLAVTGALDQEKALADALDPLNNDVGRARAHLLDRKRAR